MPDIPQFSYFAVFTARRLGPNSPEPTPRVRAGFTDLGNAARFIQTEPWPELWHIEDPKGERVRYVAYRDNYTHASRLAETSSTFYGQLDADGTKDRMVEAGWKLLDLTGDRPHYYLTDDDDGA